MRVHFVGERDDGICPTSQWGRALRARGVEVSFDEPAAMSWRSADWRRICWECDAIHLITYSQRDQMLLRRIWWARMCGCRVVRSWIGSDVLWAIHHEPSTRFALALQELGVRQLAVADHLIDELETVGVRAEYVPILTPQLSATEETPPLPETLTVLGYLPARRRAFYGGGIFDELIERCSDYRFIIVGDQPERYEGLSNVEVIPQIDHVQPLIERSTVLIRPTMHDGMPRMMLETLALGRHVITPWRYPHCHQANRIDDYVAKLNSLRTSSTLNESGRRFACREFNPAETSEAFLRKMLGAGCVSRLGARALQTCGALGFAFKNLEMWGRSSFTLPSTQNLPENAVALRAVLAGSVG